MSPSPDTERRADPPSGGTGTASPGTAIARRPRADRPLTPWTTVLRYVIAILVIAVATSAARARRPKVRNPDVPLPAQLSLEEGGLRWEFDALRRRERLLDVSDPGSPPRDVTRERPDDYQRLRRAALDRAGLQDVDVLVHEHREAADALRRLGYITNSSE